MANVERNISTAETIKYASIGAAFVAVIFQSYYIALFAGGIAVGAEIYKNSTQKHAK